MRIRILGAGVMGLVIATELTARGFDQLELVGPAPAPGPQGCSWWAGGMLAPHCEAVDAAEPFERLGRSAPEWWQRHCGAVERKGTLVLAPTRDKGELARFARRSNGHRSLHAQDIAALEPDLAGRFTTGLFYEGEAHLAPRNALSILHRNLASAGVRFHQILPESAADLVIDARGLAARDQLKDLRGVRGEMQILRCPDISLSRPVRLLHPRLPLYIVPRGEGIFMLGATMIESDRRGVITARALLELLSAAWTLHPGFGEAEVLELGADARPAFADNLPRLRRRGSTLYANGLYRHGFLLSPAVAALVADHVTTGTIPEFMDEVS